MIRQTMKLKNLVKNLLKNGEIKRNDEKNGLKKKKRKRKVLKKRKNLIRKVLEFVRYLRFTVHCIQIQVYIILDLLKNYKKNTDLIAQ